MWVTRIALLCALSATAVAATASECRLLVQADDAMQFRQQKLLVEQNCSDVELTLTHVGSLSAQVMGHNWVLVRSADVAAVAAAGQKAGRALNYQPANDSRIIAATKIVGGGESVTISFSTANLRAGEGYTYFCSTPGHGVLMRGALVVVGQRAAEVSVAAGSRPPRGEPPPSAAGARPDSGGT
jgi:azurin